MSQEKIQINQFGRAYAILTWFHSSINCWVCFATGKTMENPENATEHKTCYMLWQRHAPTPQRTTVIPYGGAIWSISAYLKISFDGRLLLRSESPSGMCAKLHTVAANNNRDHATPSLYYCLFAPHIYGCYSSRTCHSWWIAHLMAGKKVVKITCKHKLAIWITQFSCPRGHHDLEEDYKYWCAMIWFE